MTEVEILADLEFIRALSIGLAVGFACGFFTSSILALSGGKE